MNKITTLTPEQEAQIPIWRTDWFKAGSKTAPADRPRAEAAITRMYAEMGEPAPAFVWCDSPLTCSLMLGLLQSLAANEPKAKELRDSLGGSLGDSLGGSLRDSLGGSLGGSLGDSLGGSLRDSLRDSLGGSLRDSLGGSLGDSLGGSLRDSLRDSLGGSLRDSLRDSLGGSLGGSLWGSLGGSLGGSLRDSLRDSLGGSLGGSLGDSLGGSLRDSLRDSLGGSLGGSLWGDNSPLIVAARAHQSNCFWGQHEAYWIAFYAFCRDVVGVTNYDPRYSRVLDLWGEIARSACWWYPYKGLCIVSERPSHVGWDERGRIHGAEGPAVSFRDGLKLFAWHGTTVPERAIAQPDSYTGADLLAETNTEVVRAIAERLGWPRYLEKVGAITIDEWTDPNTGLGYKLLDTKQRAGEFQPRLLQKQSSVLHDGSQPLYVEPVHPGLRTAQAARKFQAMSAFVDNDDAEFELLMQHCNKSPELVYAWEA